MKIASKVILIISAVVLAIARNQLISSGNSIQTVPVHIHTAFQDFQNKYNRVYNSNSEYDFRLGVFHKNVIRIQEVNNGKFLYKAAINQFADLTREEFRTKYLSAKFSEEPKNYQKLSAPNNVVPKSADMRDQGAVNPI